MDKKYNVSLLSRTVVRSVFNRIPDEFTGVQKTVYFMLIEYITRLDNAISPFEIQLSMAGPMNVID